MFYFESLKLMICISGIGSGGWQTIGVVLVSHTAWKVSKYRVISGPYFPAFGVNPNTGKYWPKITPYLDTFQAVSIFSIWCAIALAHASTLAISLMRLRIVCATSVNNTYCLGHWNGSKLNIWSFLFNLC